MSHRAMSDDANLANRRAKMYRERAETPAEKQLKEYQQQNMQYGRRRRGCDAERGRAKIAQSSVVGLRIQSKAHCRLPLHADAPVSGAAPVTRHPSSCSSARSAHLFICRPQWPWRHGQWRALQSRRRAKGALRRLRHARSRQNAKTKMGKCSACYNDAITRLSHYRRPPYSARRFFSCSASSLRPRSAGLISRLLARMDTTPRTTLPDRPLSSARPSSPRGRTVEPSGSRIESAGTISRKKRGAPPCGGG
eukprot:scaffold20602_cov109-Isochrysis_galbana.AAC.2